MGGRPVKNCWSPRKKTARRAKQTPGRPETIFVCPLKITIGKKKFLVNQEKYLFS